MAKKNSNKRCPLQKECERDCKHVGAELGCDYYKNNAFGDSVIPDQEALRAHFDRERERKLYEAELEALPDKDDDITESVEKRLVYIPISELHPHPDNPRKDLGDLTELAESIKANGVMQNLTVVPRDESGYTVIIGHRRRGAALLAGLKELPCVVVLISPKEQLATMLLENMQRSDLTAYEQAQGFQMMIDFGDSVDGIAQKTGFSKTTVSRRLKMAELDQTVLKKVSERQLSLADFDRLSAIKNIEVRNSVLKTMGTNNFESEYSKAIVAQKTAEQKQAWLDALAAKGIKEIPESEVFATKYASVNQYRLDFHDPKELDNIIKDSVEYFYGIAYGNWIYIRTYKEITADDEEAKAKAERDYAEKRARREALEDATRRAFECRKSFIKATSNATAKKFIKEIISYAVSHEWTPNYDRFDRALYAELMDVEIPSGGLNYGLVRYETEVAPEYALLCYAYALWNDSAQSSYYDYQYMHRENTELNALYVLLIKLGHEMSDEEIALREGTSELFVKPDAEEEYQDDGYEKELEDEDGEETEIG